MRRLTSRKYRLTYRIKFIDGTKYTKQKKSAICQLLQERKMAEGTLQVDYGRGIDNVAYFNTAQRGRDLLTVFTEKQLLDYLSN